MLKRRLVMGFINSLRLLGKLPLNENKKVKADTLAQQNTLEDIAYQNPVTGGVAVYSARVLLKLEVNDQAEQLRSNMITDELSLFGKFYPK